MKKVVDVLSAYVRNAFMQCGYGTEYGNVVISDRLDLCEFQCNDAMVVAKKIGINPIEIAQRVVEKLHVEDIFETIEAVRPGYINITIDSKWVTSNVNIMLNDTERLGCEHVEQKIKYFIDYGGANIAKPLHVGHLRPAIIGESIKRILKFVGYDVISDVHLGDWGLQMGLVIEELRYRKPELPYFDENFCDDYPVEPPFTIDELEDLYPIASQKSKEDIKFMDAARRNTYELQNGNKAMVALWKHIINVSKVDLEKNYESLGVSFDLWQGESDAQPYIDDMVNDMISKGIAYKSQGAYVVDVKEENDKKEIPPCLIRKSDGASLYATYDLATLVGRESEYQPNKYIYVVDKRQELYFTQVFRVAKKANIVKTGTELIFIGFGTMNGKDGKPFKTRSGGVMRLEHLLDDVITVSKNKLETRDTLSAEEANDVARKIALAALKYGDLSNIFSKDYIFDVEKFTSFEGNTGPYLLYSIVRINSLLGRYEKASLRSIHDLRGGIIQPKSKTEKELMIKLLQFNDAVMQSATLYSPSKLCQYLMSLANLFNKFYHETNILKVSDDEIKISYICLIHLVKLVLECGISLLGFEAPMKM